MRFWLFFVLILIGFVFFQLVSLVDCIHEVGYFRVLLEPCLMFCLTSCHVSGQIFPSVSNVLIRISNRTGCFGQFESERFPARRTDRTVCEFDMTTNESRFSAPNTFCHFESPPNQLYHRKYVIFRKLLQKGLFFSNVKCILLIGDSQINNMTRVE